MIYTQYQTPTETTLVAHVAAWKAIAAVRNVDMRVRETILRALADRSPGAVVRVNLSADHARYVLGIAAQQRE